MGHTLRASHIQVTPTRTLLCRSALNPSLPHIQVTPTRNLHCRCAVNPLLPHIRVTPTRTFLCCTFPASHTGPHIQVTPTRTLLCRSALNPFLPHIQVLTYRSHPQGLCSAAVRLTLFCLTYRSSHTGHTHKDSALPQCA